MILFSDRIGVDFLEVVGAKIEVNRRNYPVAGGESGEVGERPGRGE